MTESRGPHLSAEERAAAGIRYELDRHVARVTFDRPAVLNALDARAESVLADLWREIEQDRRVFVVVVTGAGERAFCTGADMSAAAVDRTGLEYWAARSPDGFGGLSMRQTLDVPVIARVNGYALGGGMEVVLGADIVIAAESAVFGLTEPRPSSLRAIKHMVSTTGHLSAREAQSQRSEVLISALDSEDSVEGLAAFQQKRPPEWTGR